MRRDRGRRSTTWSRPRPAATEFSEEWDVDELMLDRRRRVPDPGHARSSSPSSPAPRRSSSCSTATRWSSTRRRRSSIGVETAPRDRAPGDALGDRPALARAPLRDGLPARGHQPPGHGPAGPARRVAARGLRHVRGDDGVDQGRLRPVHLPARGRRRRRAAAPDCATSATRAPEDPVQGSSQLHRPPLRPARSSERRATRRCGARSPRRSSRSRSRRRPDATSPATAAAARSTSSATAAERCAAAG